MLPSVGVPYPGVSLALPEPLQLATAADGTLFIATQAGIATYDPVETTGRWLLFDSSSVQGDVLWRATVNGSFGAEAENRVLVLDQNALLRVDTSTVSSEYDPTRTIVATPSGAVLTDTTGDLVETYVYSDSSKQRLLLASRVGRSGEPILTIGYVPGTERIASVIDGTGGTTTFHYDSNGKLNSITDPAARTTAIGIDASGDLVSVSMPTGEVRSFAYSSHRMSSATDPRGESSSYTYAANGSVQTATRAGGGTMALQPAFETAKYDANDKLYYSATFTDDRGVTHDIVVNPAGRIERDKFVAEGVSYDLQTDYATTLEHPLSPGTTVLNRKNKLFRVAQTRVNGVPLQMTSRFDVSGRPIFEEAPPGALLPAPGGGALVNQLQWGSDDRLSQVAPRSTNIFWPIERDTSGRIASIHDEQINNFGPTGRATLLSWRSDGQPSTITQHGITTTFSYDLSSANLTSSLDSIGRPLALTYEANGSGNVASVNDGTTTVGFSYDLSNRLTAITDALGNTTSLGYTNAACGCANGDRITSLITPDLDPGEQWTFGYDADGRLSAVVDPHANTETYFYTPQGDLTAFVDRKSRISVLTYDQLGRPATTTDPASRVGTFAYPIPAASHWVGASLFAGSPDAQPAPTSLTATLRDGEYQIGLRDHKPGGYPAGVELYRDATFELSFGRRFDAYGRLTRKQDRAGLAIDGGAEFGTGNWFLQQLGYDGNTPLPVLSTMNTNGGGVANYLSSFEFDLTNDNGFGPSLSPVRDEVYGRDAAGRVTSVTTTWLLGSTLQTLNTLKVTYDLANPRQVKALSSGSGDQTFTYDSRGLLTSRTLVFNRGTEVDPHVESVGTFTYDTYDELGRNTLLTYPDGHTRTQVWDELGRLTSRCYAYPGVGPTRCYTAQYDEVGNPIFLGDPEQNCTVAYDVLDRVKTVACSDGVTENYDYNELGALSLNAGTVLDTARPRLDGGGTASAGLPASLGGQPVVTDAVGRVTSVAGVGISWNRLGRPSLGGTYDPFLRRAFVGGQVLYDGPNIGGITDPFAPAVIGTRYLYDDIDHPLWMLVGSSAWYFELDTLGNVRRLREGSLYGAVAPSVDVGGYRYTAFGKLYPSSTGTPLPSYPNILFIPTWQGRLLVSSAGQIYDFRNRFWSAELGAFISPDEFDFVTREGTLWSWPGQNPLANADPLGLEGDPRAPLVSFLDAVGFGDTAAVIVGHQNALFAIASGNVDAAECEAKGILAASASLAAGAVIAAALHVKINLLKPRAGRTALRRGLDRTSRKFESPEDALDQLDDMQGAFDSSHGGTGPKIDSMAKSKQRGLQAAKTMSPRSEYFSEFFGERPFYSVG